MTQTAGSPGTETCALKGRELEQQLLAHLHFAAEQSNDAVQANVGALTAALLMHRYPSFAQRCLTGATQYFAQHPTERVSAAEMLRRGWLLGLPRWRDAAERVARVS